jgi:excisionase family DNA binding protein
MHTESMQFISVREAAQVLGVEPRSVTRYCASGRLKAARLLGRWIIPDDALAAFERPSNGRPRAATARATLLRGSRLTRAC